MRFEKLPAWSAEAAAGLSRAHESEASERALAQGVEAGRLELFRLDGSTYVVLEVAGDALLVHAYQGRALRDFAARAYRIAQRNGLRRVRFFAPEPHTLALLEDWRPREVAPGAWEIPVHRIYGAGHARLQ